MKLSHGRYVLTMLCRSIRSITQQSNRELRILYFPRWSIPTGIIYIPHDGLLEGYNKTQMGEIERIYLPQKNKIQFYLLKCFCEEQLRSVLQTEKAAHSSGVISNSLTSSSRLPPAAINALIL